MSNSFAFKTISKEELGHAISCMKTSKSAGIDKTSIRPMQGSGGTIMEFLHYVFNLYLCIPRCIIVYEIVYFQMIGKLLELPHAIYKSDDKTDCG